jgi:hypothetical protein
MGRVATGWPHSIRTRSQALLLDQPLVKIRILGKRPASSELSLGLESA